MKTERGHANVGIPLVECINCYIDKWRVRWDLKPDTEVNEMGITDNNLVTYVEDEFLHKPSIEEVKEAIAKSGVMATEDELSEIERLLNNVDLVRGYKLKIDNILNNDKWTIEDGNQ